MSMTNKNRIAITTHKGRLAFDVETRPIAPADSPREQWRVAVTRSTEIMLGMLRSTGDLMREAAEHAPEPLRSQLIEEARLADIAVSIEVARRLDPLTFPDHPEFSEDSTT